MVPGARAVLFDLDGVLVDSYAAWEALLLEAIAHFGGRELRPGEFRSRFGQSARDDCEVFLLGTTPAELERFYDERFPHWIDRVRVTRGAGETLDRLRQAGLTLACVTNAPASTARCVLRLTGLGSRLSTVVGADEVDAPKPAPDMILEALRRVVAAPAEAVLVGDSRYDVEAGRAAGVFVIGLGRDLGADLHIRRLDELPALLRDAGAARGPGSPPAAFPPG